MYKSILKEDKLFYIISESFRRYEMKKLVFICFIALLSGCNSFRCEFTHPDNMSPAMLEYCKAEASSSDVYVGK